MGRSLHGSGHKDRDGPSSDAAQSKEVVALLRGDRPRVDGQRLNMRDLKTNAPPEALPPGLRRLLVARVVPMERWEKRVDDELP